MKEKESSAIAWLLEVSSSKKNMAVSFSGGKDSLVALDLAERIGGIKKAVFSNTTIEFDETVNYVKALNNFYALDIEIVTPARNFFDLTEELGFPSRRFRWCCEVLKFGPLAKYARENKIDGFITGLRKGESARRKEYTKIDYNPVIPIPQINPILDWDEKDVWNYIKTYNLPYNPLYDYFYRVGCWCCPYRTMGEWELMERLVPEKMENLEEKLVEYANKLNIKDKEKFVTQRGWTAWIPLVVKITSGICYSYNGLVEISFYGDNDNLINKIKNIIWILTDDYKISNKIRINLNGYSIKKMNILVEKALNCLKCGACTSLCKNGALVLKDNGLWVDKNKCVHCLKCLNASVKSLRGACIARNYSRKKLRIINV